MGSIDEEVTCCVRCRLNPSTTALLVIDMQYDDAHPDFGFTLALERISPGSMKYFNERNEKVTVPTIRSLIELFRARKMPVIYVTLGSDYRDYRDWHSRQRKWILEFGKKAGVNDIFWRGSPEFRVRDELRPLPTDLILNKTTWGTFNSTTIEQQLRDRGIDSLVITGVSTSCCVETTAREAADRGFTVVLVEKGTCDRDEEFHRATLRAFKFNFGDVLKDAADVQRALDAYSSVEKEANT